MEAGRAPRKPRQSLPSEYTSRSGKSVTCAAPSRLPDREVWFVEKHSTPVGLVELHFAVRSRVYGLLVLGKERREVNSMDRHGLMPLLRSLGAVPIGWEKIYGEGGSHA